VVKCGHVLYKAGKVEGSPLMKCKSNVLKKTFSISIALLILSALTAASSGQTPAPAPAQTPSDFQGRVIDDLKIIGLVQIDESYVRNQIRTRPGMEYSQDQINQDVATLLQTGRFLDVRVQPEMVDGKLLITMTISEKPEVASIEFIGAKEIKTKDLLEELTFAVGDPMDIYEVRRGRDSIKRLYFEKGYAYVEVSVDENLLNKEHRVVYTIIENQRVRIRKVRIENNVAYSDQELMMQIETKSYIPVFRTGDFDPERAERDAVTLQNYYRERGFLDAEVSYVQEFVDVAREKLEVIFRVNEGIRYSVGEIRIQGNNVFTDEELLEAMGLKVGNYYTKARENTDVKNLTNKYGACGYIYAKITPSWVFSAEPEKVVVTLTINEGNQFQVGWIEVNGNYRTKEKVVRRELLFFPEEIYNTTKTRESERRLKETGLFTSATIQPVGDQANIRDALVTVEENEKNIMFIAGVGASSDSGLLGNIVLENNNFDLFDTPRDWKEFFKGRSFRGAGQSFKIQLEPGTEVSRFRINFREPYLMDKPIGFGTSLYLFERGRDGYNEERGGGNFSFDKKFKQGLLKNWIGEISFRAEVVQVDDRDAFAAKDIRDVDGNNYLSSAKVALLRDTTNSQFEPSEGNRLRLSYEQAGAMGGDFYHAKFRSGITKFWTVAIDEQDRRSILTAHARLGYIFGDAPVFERFYAGGIGSIRGFDYRGISPRDGLRKNRIGGEFMVVTGAEYSFPLWGKSLRGLLFTDMGTIEEDIEIKNWRASIGAGIRLNLDFFGPVPMEFDFAIPVSKDSEDDTRVFSFFIGLPFF